MPTNNGFMVSKWCRLSWPRTPRFLPAKRQTTERSGYLELAGGCSNLQMALAGALGNPKFPMQQPPPARQQPRRAREAGSPVGHSKPLTPCRSLFFSRSSSREVRIRVPFCPLSTLAGEPSRKKRNGKRALLQNLVLILSSEVEI